MGVHIEPPFMFRPVVVNDAVELEISCARCDHGQHLNGKGGGTIPLDRAQDLYAALGEALAEALAIDPPALVASRGEAPRPFPPVLESARMLPPELEAELVRDRKSAAAGEDEP